MDLIFITEARYARTPDGNVYSLESSFSYSLYQRYLQYFDSVTIVARVKKGSYDEVIETNLVTKAGVDVVSLPYYVGLNGFLKNRGKLSARMKQVLRDNVNDNTAVILRIPGRVGAAGIARLREMGVPYGLEVVGDPYDVLSPGATRHPLRPLIRILSYFSLKRLTYDAPAALYVTQRKLQERYPCRNFSIGASDVVMPPEAFRKSEKPLFQEEPVKIICVGTLEQMYKAPDTALKALKILKQRGVNCHLWWVGDGIFRPEMEALADRLGVSSMATFTGKLSSGDAVRNELDKADIFLMPSRQEGLPRAMVEAMARRLPCIGSDVGGMSELLDKALIVPPNKPQKVADKVQYLIDNPGFARQQGLRNFNTAREYAEEKLGNKREQFYNHLKNLYPERVGITP